MARTLPRLRWPEELPVVARRAEIAETIAAHQVVVVCGETGSGKTTQLPKICLEIGRGMDGLIGHTQPRRIAARSVALRIAEELDSPLGRHVGYQVRFQDRTGPDCSIKVMTDGILLAETQHDRLLRRYDTIIIDEAHERSLNIDFLLGYLHRLRRRRPDLKIVITSATIDPERFSRHFDGAPIVEVSGRTYPVEVRYRPIGPDDADDPRRLQEAILAAVDEVAALGPGDVLVFLAGEREIRETAEALRKHHPPHTQIVPLYARLSLADQAKVFQRHTGRRIVLATNVAETSLTVPGIHYVIDPGHARISRYSARRGVQLLPIEAVSKASADQRKGRCGRISAGVCIRLYDEDDFARREDFTDPEILRTSLASVILRMHALALGAVDEFPFLEPPRRAAVRDGYHTLHELNALDDNEQLTDLGRRLARLPVDPRIGRMILAGEKENALREVLVIAAALSTNDPRDRPMESQAAADEAHEPFRDEASDFMTYLNIWQFYHEQKRHLSWNKLRKACQEHYLSFVRMREWVELEQQLRRLATETGMHLSEDPAAPDAVHRALLAGLLSHVATRGERFNYTGAGGHRVHLFPGSTLFKNGPRWIVAAELVETTRLYARTAARIDPEWLEAIGQHVVKRSHSNPRWSRRSARVLADERVSLYGLTIVERRTVHYGPIDPQVSREMFIQEALVEGLYDGEGAFIEHNRGVLASLETLEAKSRRRDLLAHPAVRYAFFDKRLPEDVWSGKRFEAWRGTVEKRDPETLFMRHEDLMLHDAAAITAELYPDALEMGGNTFALSYTHDTDSDADGVSVIVPVEAINRIEPERLDWLVPGYLEEKLTALIRGLPKSLRRSFVPAPDFAAACVDRMPFGEGPLLRTLARTLAEMAAVTVPPDAWSAETLPPHLRMRVCIVDGLGDTVAAGRDLDAVRGRVGAASAAAFAEVADETFQRAGLTRWEFGEVPEAVTVSRAGLTLVGYPTFVDEGTSVALRLTDDAGGAERGLRAGLRRLVVLALPGEIESYLDTMPAIDSMRLAYASLGSRAGLDEGLTLLIADRAFLGEGPLPRDRRAFEACLDGGYAGLWPVARDVVDLVSRILEANQTLAITLERDVPPPWRGAVADIRYQASELLREGFLAGTPYGWLGQFPRYLAAAEARFRKLARGGHARDAEQQAVFLPRWQAYTDRAVRHAEQGIFDPNLEYYRWMLEELRVSLFAQELGTAVPVSTKRLDKQWGRVR